MISFENGEGKRKNLIIVFKLFKCKNNYKNNNGDDKKV